MNKILQLIRWRFVICVMTSILFSACATVSTVQPPGANNDLKGYKRAYIETLPKDEFLINQALVYELSDMGIEVVTIPLAEPSKKDLLVKYSYSSGWDLTKYLKAFQIQFIDASTATIVSSTSYESAGIWQGRRDGRLEAAFNDLRKRSGFPPTKQFR